MSNPEIRFTDREYQALLDAAERIQSRWGRETVNASMDCDYGHDMIEELQAALVGRAHQRGMVEGARQVWDEMRRAPEWSAWSVAREAVVSIEGDA